MEPLHHECAGNRADWNADHEVPRLVVDHGSCGVERIPVRERCPAHTTAFRRNASTGRMLTDHHEIRFAGWYADAGVCVGSGPTCSIRIRPHDGHRSDLPGDDGMAERTGTVSGRHVSSGTVHALLQILQCLVAILFSHKALLPRNCMPSQTAHTPPRGTQQALPVPLAKGTGSACQTCSCVFYFLLSRWQATVCPGATSMTRGSCSLQIGIA